MKIKKCLKGENLYLDPLIRALVDHFQYSIKDINSYDELTDEEKKIITKEIFNELVEHE